MKNAIWCWCESTRLFSLRVTIDLDPIFRQQGGQSGVYQKFYYFFIMGTHRGVIPCSIAQHIWLPYTTWKMAPLVGNNNMERHIWYTPLLPWPIFDPPAAWLQANIVTAEFHFNESNIRLYSLDAYQFGAQKLDISIYQGLTLNLTYSGMRIYADPGMWLHSQLANFSQF